MSQILVFIFQLEIPQQPSKQPLESKAQLLLVLDVEYLRLNYYHNPHTVIQGLIMGLLMTRPWMYKHIIFHSLVLVYTWVMITVQIPNLDLSVHLGREALSS